MMEELFTGWISYYLGNRKLPMIFNASIHTFVFMVRTVVCRMRNILFTMVQEVLSPPWYNHQYDICPCVVKKALSSERSTGLTVSMLNTTVEWVVDCFSLPLFFKSLSNGFSSSSRGGRSFGGLGMILPETGGDRKKNSWHKNRREKFNFIYWQDFLF